MTYFSLELSNPVWIQTQHTIADILTKEKSSALHVNLRTHTIEDPA